MKPGATSGIKEKMMDHRLNKHHGESGASKHTENKDHLRDTIDFPASLEFLQPLRCGQLVWFIKFIGWYSLY